MCCQTTSSQVTSFSNLTDRRSRPVYPHLHVCCPPTPHCAATGKTHLPSPYLPSPSDRPLRLTRRGRTGATAGRGGRFALRLGMRTAACACAGVGGTARGMTGGRPRGGRFGARGRRGDLHARPARETWKPGRAGGGRGGNVPRPTGARVGHAASCVPWWAVPTRSTHRVLPEGADSSGCRRVRWCRSYLACRRAR